MSKSSILLGSYIIFCTSGFAQKKVEGYWGNPHLDVAYAAAATNDGGYVMTGLTKSGIDNTYGDIIVIKTDCRGNLVWARTYGGEKLEGGNGIIQVADGGYLISGHTEDFGARDCDAFLMKLDKNGNKEWLKVYGDEDDDIGEGALQMPDGGYVFAGITASYGNAPGDHESRHTYFVRTNGTGDMMRWKYYACNAQEYAYSIATVKSGGFLAAGWSMTANSAIHDGWLLRLKDNGDTAWTRYYRKNGDTRFYKIIPTNDGGYMMAGQTAVSSSTRPQGFAVKLDAEGNELWEKIMGSANEGILFHDVAQLPDGRFLFSGTNYSADTTGNVYIVTTDANGNVLNTEISGGSSSYATSIAAQGNNGYIIAGATAKYGDAEGDLYYAGIDNTSSGVQGTTVQMPRVFPNPAKDKVLIVLPDAEAYQYAAIVITSMDGRIMERRDNVLSKDLTISCDKMPRGVYVLNVTCSDGNVYKSKFVVE